MMEKYERRIYVIAGCTKEKIDEETVGFIDIYEDFQGRDVLTFTCPLCGKQHKSLRFG